MTIICKNCKTENPDDFLVCKNCKKLLKKNTEQGFKTGKKTIIFIFVLIFAVVASLTYKIFDKKAFKTVSLLDKESDVYAVEIKLPKKWIPIGKVLHNPKSIPNMYTFFVAAINPKAEVDLQFFSTQFETDNGQEFIKTGRFNNVKSEDYITNIVKKISPTATNITLIKNDKIDKKTLIDAEIEKTLFNLVYFDINPSTPKGKSWINDYNIVPFKYTFSFYENGKKYYQLIEGRFTFFVQCFSNRLEQDAPIHTAIKFIRCENVFSYKTEESLFKKNYIHYLIFKKNLRINPEWEEITNLRRTEKLSEITYLTTNSLIGGDKFNREKFKNTIYYIEYLDNKSKKQLRKFYDKILKRTIKNMK